MKLLIFYLCFCFFLLTQYQINYDPPLKRTLIEVNVIIDGQSQQVILPIFSTINDLFIQEKLQDMNLSSINMNQMLHHLDTIHLSTIETTPIKACISINFADVTLLDTLPGIGEKTAESIIEFRQLYGLFQHLEDLMKVPGIKVAKYEGLKDEICL